MADDDNDRVLVSPMTHSDKVRKQQMFCVLYGGCRTLSTWLTPVQWHIGHLACPPSSFILCVLYLLGNCGEKRQEECVAHEACNGL